MKLTTHFRAHRGATIVLLLVSSLAGLTLATKSTTSSAADKQREVATSDKLQTSPNERRDLLAIPSAIDGTSAAATSKSQKVAASSAAGEESAVSPIAEKKQGDVASSALDSSVADLFNSEDYVQVKPDEITINENGRMQLNPGAESSGALDSPVDRQLAEQKSVDDELNAQLSQDFIHEQESAAYQQAAYSSGESVEVTPRVSTSYSVNNKQPRRQQPQHYGQPTGPSSADYRGVRGHQQQQQQPQQKKPYGGAGMPTHHAPASYQGGRGGAPVGAHPPRTPPSYMALKGKLTGINSLVSQYPHPAPGYPHQVPRHLPRGAAAGYAAFRDFVRAHASKYRGAGPAPMQQAGYGPPLQAPSKGPAPAGYGPAAEPAQGGYEAPTSSGYGAPAPAPAPGGYGAAPAPAGYGSSPAKRSPSKTKVTVAQAFIPHLSSPGASGYGSTQSSSSSSSQYDGRQMNAYTSQVLSKLYGANAPQGVGRPEYSKDFGMVIHYPQATVYTEPMTVEQLHKLAGSGISQLLEQLQYNLAHGHRDESNTIRANNKHHIGAGLTIQAKEYYAQGKGGQYFPTTAAVISTEKQQGASGGYDSSSSSSAPLDQGAYGSSGPKAQELGSGYERVKQAAHAGSAKYSSAGAGQSHYQQPKQQQQQQQQQQSGYGISAAGKYKGGNGDSLAAIANMIGAELDALYKTNGNKQSGAYQSAGHHQQQGGQKYGQSQTRGYAGARPQGHHAARGRGPRKGPQGNTRYQMQQQQHQLRPAMKIVSNYGGNPYQARPRHHRHSQKQPQQQGGGHRKPMAPPGYGPRARPQQQHHQQRPAAQGYNQQQRQPQQQSYQQQQQSYHQAEQAMNQEMMQLLHEIQAGDDQYNNKNNPLTKINHQAYPPKVTQPKYPQQQQQAQTYAAGNGASGVQAYHQQQLQSAYAQHDGLEIPQGPNDQIGEIADLIEALKGSLESDKAEGAGYESNGKQTSDGSSNGDHIRYLTSALAQSPTYAMQVPVNTASGTGQAANGYDSSASNESGGHQKGAPSSLGYQQQGQQDSAAYGQQQQQSAGAGPSGVQDSYSQAAAVISGGHGMQVQQDSAGYNQQHSAAGEYQATRYNNQRQEQQQHQSSAAAGRMMMMIQDAYAQAPAAAAGQSEYNQQQQAPASNDAGYSMQPAPASGASAPAGSGQQYQQLSSSYGTPTLPAAQNVISGVYPHQQQQEQNYAGVGAPIDANSGGYTTSEHTQVINHIVPVASVHKQAAPTSSSSSSGGYGSVANPSAASSASLSSHQEQQPANQIALAPPTESHYKQAQSLSSFVDSLPSEYQDLLRQPALIDGQSGVSHLAILSGSDQQLTSTTSSDGQYEQQQQPNQQQQQANHGGYSAAAATSAPSLAPAHASSGHYEPSPAASSASVTRQLAPSTSQKAVSSSSPVASLSSSASPASSSSSSSSSSFSSSPAAAAAPIASSSSSADNSSAASSQKAKGQQQR